MGDDAPVWRADRTRWPIVTIQAVGGTPGAVPDQSTLFREFDDLVARSGRVALVWDLTRAKPDPTRRQLVVNWLKDNWDVVADRVLSAALVAPRPLQRHAITAVLWFFDVPFPTKAFDTLEHAVEWSERLLVEDDASKRAKG